MFLGRLLLSRYCRRQLLASCSERVLGYTIQDLVLLPPTRESFLSLPRGQGAAANLADLLDGDNKDFVGNFEKKMKLSDEELAGGLEDTEEPGCFLDPVLERDP